MQASGQTTQGETGEHVGHLLVDRGDHFAHSVGVRLVVELAMKKAIECLDIHYYRINHVVQSLLK